MMTGVGAPRTAYTGRFAPSPTGELHAGSLVAALASWLDARAHGGTWLVRIEDIDTPRCVRGAADDILRQLAACGLVPDAPPVYQSQRGHLYQAALDDLIVKQHAYPCGCSRQDIAQALAVQGIVTPRTAELVYPGTCRHGLHGKPARAWRMRTDADADHFYKEKSLFAQQIRAQAAIKNIASDSIVWHDRLLGEQTQNVPEAVGDFVLKRADGLWAYQLAVVVDDVAQGITHVVRGEDLADNTARQILLQRALGYARPHYLHTPLVLGSNGEKLSKQNGAQALQVGHPEQALKAVCAAATILGLDTTFSAINELLSNAVTQWHDKCKKIQELFTAST
jgi:glutamyl-Q tRNA(Asp) synthetase